MGTEPVGNVQALQVLVADLFVVWEQSTCVSSFPRTDSCLMLLGQLITDALYSTNPVGTNPTG